MNWEGSSIWATVVFMCLTVCVCGYCLCVSVHLFLSLRCLSVCVTRPQILAQGKSSPTAPPKQSNKLDNMLGSLQSDLHKLGVQTVAKGVCGACNKPIVGQVTLQTQRPHSCRTHTGCMHTFTLICTQAHTLTFNFTGLITYVFWSLLNVFHVSGVVVFSFWIS
jgi:hypothetical protein